MATTFNSIWFNSADASTVVFPLTIPSTLTVHWGVSEPITYNDTTDVSYQYGPAQLGLVDVSVDGSVNGWNYHTFTGADACAYMLRDISMVGPLRISNGGNAFKNATLMTWSASDPLLLYTDNDSNIPVTDLSGMFLNCASFDGAIGNWDVSGILDMGSMFKGCVSFNQSLNTWDVSLVTNMAQIFNGATVFNSDISSWNVENVTSLQSAFQNAQAFNHSLYRWNTASLNNVQDMFNGASAFNSDLNSLNLRKVTAFNGMFDNTSFLGSYPILNWSVSASQHSSLLSDISTGGIGNNYTNVPDPESVSWSIICPSSCCITHWDTCDNIVVLPLHDDYTSDVSVAWGRGIETVGYTNNDISYNYGATGSHTIAIVGDISGWTTNATGREARRYLKVVAKTNAIKPALTGYGFADCCLMVWTATDSPILNESLEGTFQNDFSFDGDLSGWNTQDVTSFRRLFLGCTSFNNNSVSDWNTRYVTDMSGTFDGASKFNQDLRWNTVSLNTLSHTFRDASLFNGDISGWNVSNVTTMNSAFRGASDFQGQIGGWNTVSVENLDNTFLGAESFNGDISSWDVAGVTTMNGTFSGATTFNRPLLRWDVRKVTDFENFLQGVPYTNDINGWDISSVSTLDPNLSGIVTDSWLGTQPIINWRIQQGLASSTVNLLNSYNDTSYVSVTDPDNTQTVRIIPRTAFLTKWVTDGVDNSIQLPLGDGADVSIHWDDAQTITVNNSSTTWTDLSHNYPTAGTHFIAVRGDISGWKGSAVVTDATYLRDVLHCGNLVITQDGGGFQNFPKMEWTADDSLNLTGLTNIDALFQDSVSMNGDLSGWQTGQITSMNGTFRNCTDFIGTGLDSWDTTQVTTMNAMFSGATAFNTDISSWTTTALENLGNTFTSATSFNKDLSWNVTRVTTLEETFRGASAFNGNIGNWVTSSLHTMHGTFRDALAFNGDISGWNTSRVTDMSATFYGASVFNRPLYDWVTASATTVTSMFRGATDFSGDLNGWNLREVRAGGFNSMFVDTGLSAYITTNNPIFLWSVSMGVSTEALREITEDSSASYSMLRDPANTSYAILVPTDSFVSRWDTCDNVVQLPFLPNYSSDVCVAWGDNTAVQGFSTNDISHNYEASGRYTIVVHGDMSGWNASTYSPPPDSYLREVTQTGQLWPANTAGAFFDCSAMIWTASDSPKLDGIATLSNWFQNCASFDGNLSSWDVSSVTSLKNTFQDCVSFNNNSITNWITNSIETLNSTFHGASVFNQDLSWNVALVTDMTNVFRDALAFNGDISSWQVGLVSDFSGAFRNASSFTRNLNSWDMRAATNLQGMFQGATNIGDIAGWDLSAVTASVNIQGMLPTSYVQNRDFIFNWRVPTDISTGALSSLTGGLSGNYVLLADPKEANTHRIVPRNSCVTIWTANAGDQVTLPISLTDSDASVHWDDGAVRGSTPTEQLSALNHNFVGSGDHYVVLRGADISGWNARANPPDVSLTGIMQAGNMRLADASGAFEDCTRLVWYLASTDNSLIQSTRTLEDCFRNCASFDANLDGWDVSSITSIRRMFQNCTSFNHDLSWNVSSVIDMSGAFSGATQFNYDLQDWSVGKVNTMAGMFQGATAFRGDIAGWETKLVTDFTDMLDPSYIEDLFPMFRWSICGDISTTLFNQVMNGADNSGDYHMIRRKYADGVGFYWIVPEGALLLKWSTDDTNAPNSQTVVLPFSAGNSDLSIGWADKSVSVETFNSQAGYITHTYPSYGGSKDHYITIRGLTGQWNMQDSDIANGTAAAGASRLKAILQCGTTFKLKDASGAFKDCNNMYWLADDSLNVTDNTTFEQWFYNCTHLNMGTVGDFSVADMNDWYTSNVTSLRQTFYNCPEFNGKVCDWDTRNVTDMYQTFYNCQTFQGTGDLSGWDVSGVTDMQQAFLNCWVFNSSISMWDTSNCTNMYETFRDAHDFNSDLSWNVSNVTDIRGMFYDAHSFNGDIRNWDVQRISSLADTFHDAADFKSQLRDWSVGNVTSLSYTFAGATDFNSDISHWDVRNVQNMDSTFLNASTYDQSLNDWSVNQVTTMYETFRGASSFNQPIEDWCVNNVQTMYGMFRGALEFDQSLDRWITASVSTMANMFKEADSFNHYIDSWDTSQVTDMQYMFNEADTFDQSLHHWNTHRVTSMRDMFNNARAFDNDISNWITSSCNDMQYMFAHAPYNRPMPNWDLSAVRNTSYMFYDASQFHQEIGSWDLHSATDMQHMFHDAKAFNGDISMWNPESCVNMNSIFEGAGVFNHDLSWNVGNVQYLRRAFYDASAQLGYRTVLIPSTRNKYRTVSHMGDWNTSSVVDLSGTFEGAKLFNANIADWNVANVTTMARTFARTGAFNQNIGGWNTGQVTSLDGTFQDTSSFNCNLNSWNVRNVTSLCNTFRDTVQFNSPLSRWLTTSVNTMAGTFNGAESFYGSLDGWDTRQVTDFTDFGLTSQYVLQVTPEFSTNHRPNSWQLQVDASDDILVNTSQREQYEYIPAGGYNRLKATTRTSTNKYM